MRNRFKLGRKVMTRAVAEKIQKNLAFGKDVFKAFSRFVRADWGEMDKEDIATNNDALKNGERLFGAYETCEGKIWIITEWDRSVTTVLFPSDY